MRHAELFVRRLGAALVRASPAPTVSETKGRWLNGKPGARRVREERTGLAHHGAPRLPDNFHKYNLWEGGKHVRGAVRLVLSQPHPDSAVLKGTDLGGAAPSWRGDVVGAVAGLRVAPPGGTPRILARPWRRSTLDLHHAPGAKTVVLAVQRARLGSELHTSRMLACLCRPGSCCLIISMVVAVYSQLASFQQLASLVHTSYHRHSLCGRRFRCRRFWDKGFAFSITV
mmetsp:Transcript_10898/g.20492  ORF Transcript_10898/g.20492 Transcript_10898/m.20492 type:complete len:228 (+) Transcript_10898:2356-3039(+)